jgi:hypothetical protein
MQPKTLNRNVIAYLAVAGWILVSTIYSYVLEQQGAPVRYIGWTDSLLMILLALLLFMQEKGGFPQPLDPAIPNRHRFLVPILAGLVFGILDIVAIRVIMHPEPYTSLPPFLQPFPYSVFLYINGALYMEIFYRLVPFMLVMLPVTRTAAPRYHFPAFLAIAILTSLAEPIGQFPDGPTWFRVYATASGFAMNFLQAWYFRKYGFFASLSVRAGHYLIWHILQGIYVEQFELG